MSGNHDGCPAWEECVTFASWGRLLAAHQRLVAVVALMSLVVAIIGMVLISPDLSADGFVSEQAESARVDETLAREFDHGSDSLVFLFDANRPVSDPEVQQAVEEALAPIISDSRFEIHALAAC